MIMGLLSILPTILLITKPLKTPLVLLAYAPLTLLTGTQLTTFVLNVLLRLLPSTKLLKNARLAQLIQLGTICLKPVWDSITTALPTSFGTKLVKSAILLLLVVPMKSSIRKLVNVRPSSSKLAKWVSVLLPLHSGTNKVSIARNVQLKLLSGMKLPESVSLAQTSQSLMSPPKNVSQM